MKLPAELSFTVYILTLVMVKALQCQYQLKKMEESIVLSEEWF